MSRARFALVPVALSALLLAGCVGQNNQPQGGETPDPVDSGALLVALEQVAPGLGDESTVQDAEEICADVEAGEDADTVDEHALELLSDQAEGELTLAQAQQAVVVITTDYCSEGNSEQN